LVVLLKQIIIDKPYQLGVMQGRLLPKYQRRYQAHPVGYWRDEFPLAADLGLDLIEFILDYNDWEQNPLMSSEGIDSIVAAVERYGVSVRSVCADYFMEAPLHSIDTDIVRKSQSVLNQLIENSSQLGVTDIVIPCVDVSSLKSEDAAERFYVGMMPAVATAERFDVNLALETDLPPEAFATVLRRFDSTRIKVNYDTGNSASLGYKPQQEIAFYGGYITDVHIKDRICGGGSVELGSGDMDFDAFFTSLPVGNVDVFFIMQAFRDDEGVAVLQKQLEWIMPKLDSWSLRRTL
jgi:L-ribulose-5-phosphate 3-epimerase UlaE